MNISRLAVLAVIFMMVLSAFVAIPAYNASADHENHDDVHDHDHFPSFSELDENDDGKIESNELLVICPDDLSDEECMDIFNQFSGDDGLMDENEYHNFISSNSSQDGSDFRILNFDVVLEMEDLSNWHVTVTGTYPIEESDRFREDLAEFCEDVMGGNPDEITKDCYETFLTMEDDHDDHGPMMVCYDSGIHEVDFSITSQDECDAAGLMWVDMNSGPNGGDHGHNNDGWHCPPGLTDDECEMMEDCLDNNMAGMSCNRMMYDYCNDNPDHCDSHNDEGNFFYVMFAYDDGDITAEEFMTNNAIQSMFNNDDNHDDNHNNDCEDYYGENDDRCYPYVNPGLYQTDFITVSVDQEVSIHSNFESSYTPPPSFICGDGTEIDFIHVNNNTVDCEDGADEQWYDSNTPDDTSDDCQEAVDEDCEGEPVNWFDCHDGTQVWIYQVNDYNWDCEDGEDEFWSYDTWNHWNGDIYLLEGEHEYIPGIDLTPDEIFAVEDTYCEWANTNKTHVDCNYYMKANLVANQVYTLVTVTGCYTAFNGNFLECDEFGTYNHTMSHGDGSETRISGEIYSSPRGYCGGCWDHDGDDDDYVQDSAANFTYHTHNTFSKYVNFQLYSTETFVVGPEGFEGYMTTSGHTCEELDNGSDDCYGSGFDVYLYDAFDTTDTFSEIINMSDYHYNYDWDCAVDYCEFKHMNLELEEGDYVIVITTDGEYDSSVVLNNSIFDFDGDLITYSNSELRNAYHEYEDGEMTLVAGDERLYFPGYYWYNYHHNYYDDHHEDHHDYSYELMMEFRENMTAYENGDINATMSADNILGILIAMDDEGLFDYHDDHHDDHHDGSSMTLGYFDVSSWDSTNDLQAIVDWFNDEYYYHDDEERLTVDDFLDMCGADHEDVDSDVAQCVLDQAMSMLDYDHHDDHHDGVYWSQWNYCEWEGDSSLQDGDMRWYCTDNDDGTNGFEDWWYYCEAHDDGMDGTTYFCTDDFGQSADYENSASNDYYVTGGSPNGDHGDHDDHGDHGDHGDHDDHDDNDNQDTPALLNGIIGIEDPDNAGDDCNPSVDDPHLMGNVDDNEGHPLTCTFEFKIHFDGVDESLDTHVAFIPFQAQDDWTLTLKNALGYEVTSCDNCEMSDDGVMTGIGPVNLTIGKVVPQPDCDYIVGLSADGMAFDPVKLAISAGETVCWQWKDAAMAHNVVEIEGEYDSSSDLTGINFGFNSGDPAMTVDFRHTFTEDNRVHYYVCAPHAQLGMVGQVTVGNGTDDPVQQVIEDEEVPSIGFVLGSLVLVGAAGLRRRIH